MEKIPYEKPTLEKQESMTFMFEPFKSKCPPSCNYKQDINCPSSCVHHAQIGCRQCSGCHGCR